MVFEGEGGSLNLCDAPRLEGRYTNHKLEEQMGTELLTALTQWMALAASIMAPIALVWIVYGTRSRYMLKVRLWKLVSGEANSKDPEVQAFFDEQATLMFFHFTQIDADDMADMKRHIRWSKNTGIPLWLVRKAKSYFDKKNLCIKEKDVKMLRFNKFSLRFMSVVLIFLAAPMIFVFLSPQAILRFNESKQWFALDQNSAHVLFAGDANALTKVQCNSLQPEDIVRSKFQDKDAKALCDAWASPGVVASYVEKNVKQQRSASGVMLLLLFFFTFNTWSGASSAEAAKEIHRRLKKEKSVTTQDEVVTD